MNELHEISARSWWRLAESGEIRWIEVASWCYGAYSATTGEAADDWFFLDMIAVIRAMNEHLEVAA